MALKITNQNGVFVAVGPINAATSKSFQNHLNILIEKYKKVTINIDDVNQIDTNGLSVLKEFYLRGLRYNRDFSIVGYGCKEIHNEFKLEEAL